MKKTILLLICFLSVFVVHGQEPAPPTQDWCKWAFQQIPDHRNISEVDSKAFSVDFHTLLKIAFTIDEWEHQKNPGDIGAEFLSYWYAGNGDSPLDDPDHSIQYRVGKVQDGKSNVAVIIRTPAWLPNGPEYHRFIMHLIFEDDAWRIDDWFNWGDYERGFEGSMREDCRKTHFLVCESNPGEAVAWIFPSDTRTINHLRIYWRRYHNILAQVRLLDDDMRRRSA